MSQSINFQSYLAIFLGGSSTKLSSENGLGLKHTTSCLGWGLNPGHALAIYQMSYGAFPMRSKGINVMAKFKKRLLTN